MTLTGKHGFPTGIRPHSVFDDISGREICVRFLRHTCDNLSVTMLVIWFSFSGDCVHLPGDCSTASLTYHFEVFFG